MHDPPALAWRLQDQLGVRPAQGQQQGARTVAALPAAGACMSPALALALPEPVDLTQHTPLAPHLQGAVWLPAQRCRGLCSIGDLSHPHRQRARLPRRQQRAVQPQRAGMPQVRRCAARAAGAVWRVQPGEWAVQQAMNGLAVLGCPRVTRGCIQLTSGRLATARCISPIGCLEVEQCHARSGCA